MTALLAAGSRVGRAGVPQTHPADPPVDERLLEFLGSVDSSGAAAEDSRRPEDGSWLAYLSQLQIGKATQPPPPRAAQPKPAGAVPGADKPGGVRGTRP